MKGLQGQMRALELAPGRRLEEQEPVLKQRQLAEGLAWDPMGTEPTAVVRASFASPGYVVSILIRDEAVD